MPWFFKELKQELSMMSSNYKNYNKKISNENISELSNLDLKQPNIKILELGCGDASLWNKNFNHILKLGNNINRFFRWYAKRTLKKI